MGPGGVREGVRMEEEQEVEGGREGGAEEGLQAMREEGSGDRRCSRD